MATIEDLPGLVRKRLGLGRWFLRSGAVTSVEPVAGDGSSWGGDGPGAAGEVGVTPALAGHTARHPDRDECEDERDPAHRKQILGLGACRLSTVGTGCRQSVHRNVDLSIATCCDGMVGDGLG
jgi:hypothetical protein